jgi:hypothetical protein
MKSKEKSKKVNRNEKKLIEMKLKYSINLVVFKYKIQNIYMIILYK